MRLKSSEGIHLNTAPSNLEETRGNDRKGGNMREWEELRGNIKEQVRIKENNQEIR